MFAIVLIILIYLKREPFYTGLRTTSLRQIRTSIIFLITILGFDKKLNTAEAGAKGGWGRENSPLTQ